MIQQKLISVVLPTYNGERYIQEAISSILNQTYKKFELIVVDDCSTDNTPNLLEGFRIKDSRIKIIKNKRNLKLPASLNVGHRMAQGEYLTWTSDDNVLQINFLERLIEILETNGEDVVYSDFNIISEIGKFIRVCKTSPASHLPLENGIGASFMYRKQVFEQLQFNEQMQGIEDYDFWVRAVQVFRFKHVGEVLYHYRIHSLSLSHEIGTDLIKSLTFEENLKKLLFHLKVFSPESQELLFKFQRRNDWNWKYFLKHRKQFEDEYKNWQGILPTSYKNFNNRYLEILRELLLYCDQRRIILKLIIYKPQLFSMRFSRLTTFRILTRLFFSEI